MVSTVGFNAIKLPDDLGMVNIYQSTQKNGDDLGMILSLGLPQP